MATITYTPAQIASQAALKAKIASPELDYQKPVSTVPPVAKPVSPTTPASTLNLNTTSNSGITGGSDNVRKDLTSVQSTADKLDSLLSDNTLLTQALNVQPYGSTDAGKTDLDNVRSTLKNIGVLSADEQSSINDAGNAEGAKFDPLITDAANQKTQGLPKANIAAGERGGFMNTQFAGTAALTPTNGGNFQGAGGELERIKSVYDNNISNLQAQKIQAISAAKSAARQMLLTGKRDNANQVVQLYNLAKQANDDANNLAAEKINVLSNYQKVVDAHTASKDQSVKSALDKLDTIGTVGSGSLSEQDQATIDSVYGQGFTQKYKTVAQEAQTAKTDAQKADVAGKIIDIMKELPTGTSKTINGVTYEGIATSDPNTVTFKEDDGTYVHYVTVDKSTGEVLHTAQGSKIVRPATGGSSVASSGVSDATANKLLDSKGADGFVNTGLYSDALDEAARNGAKAVNAFKTRFPTSYLNAQDPTAVRFIQSNSQAINPPDSGNVY